MKEEINQVELQQFNSYGKIFTALLLITIFSAVPLAMFLNYYGLIIWGIICAITMYYALKVEKFKKQNNIQTYKEIIAFTEGKRLDEIEKNQEYGKRPYQKVLLVLGSAVITLVICLVLFFCIESIWIIRSCINNNMGIKWILLINLAKNE